MLNGRNCVVNIYKSFTFVIFSSLVGCSLPIGLMPDNDMGDSDSYTRHGYGVNETLIGTYSVTYKGPAITAFDASDSAWMMVDKKAELLCGEDNYLLRQKIEKKIAEGVGGGWSQLVSAELVCDIESEAQYEALIEKRNEQLEKERLEKKKALATTAEENPCLVREIKNAYSHATEFYVNGFYEEAMICFNKSIENSTNVRESQFQIGMMYELGYGVKADLETAKLWYQKSASHIN